jgi:hypothetical protein
LKKSDAKQTDQTLVGTLTKFRDTVTGSIPNVLRIPFVTEADFVGHLSDSIDKAQKDAHDQLATEKKNRITEIEALRAKYAARPAEFKSQLVETLGQTDVAGTNTTGAEASSYEANTKRVEELRFAAIQAEEQREVKNIGKINEAAYATKDGLYRRFVAGFLTQYIKDQKEQSPHPGTFSETVLDSQRGGHVIYQVFYLAFLGVLVFGILFPIYLLLATLPPFAGSVEPLTDRVKDLLSRQGIAGAVAAPEVVKTLALSMAAIGIGAAVVIANNPVSQKGSGDTVGATSPDSLYPKPPVSPGSRPSPAVPTPSPEVTPTPTSSPPPDVTPPPGPTPVQLHQTFTLDDSRITQLKDGLTGLQTDFGTLQRRVDNDLNKKAAQSDFINLEQRVVPKLNDVVRRTAGLEVGDPQSLKENVKTLGDSVETIRTTNIPNLRSDLTKRVDASNMAIAGFREGTQGRSLLKRTRELLGRERYYATPSSFGVLYNLICGGVNCQPGSREEAILANYRTLSPDSAVMKKKDFLNRLGISSSAPSRWEAVLLRYSRVPY